MFVELTDKNTNCRIAINVNQIIYIWKEGQSCSIDTVVHNFGQNIIIKESYEEVLNKINEKG